MNTYFLPIHFAIHRVVSVCSKTKWVTLLCGIILAGHGVPVQCQNILVNPGAGSYPTLKAAFDAINIGTHTGDLTVDITSSTTETEPCVLVASGTGSALYTSILIRPSGGAAVSVSGAIAPGNPLVEFFGADYVTIDGLNSGGNALTLSNTTASATGGTCTIRFRSDATYNTITRCSIQGSASMTVGSNGGVIYFSDAVSTGNDFNTISFCDIGPAGTNLPTKCIYSLGTSTNTSLYNSDVTITGNSIFDYFGASMTSAGVYLSGGNSEWTISDNRFFQTAPRTQTTGTIHAGIQLANTNINNCLISGNTIGFSNASGTGTYSITGNSTGCKFYPIYLSAHGTVTPTSIQGNVISNISLTGNLNGNNTASSFTGIHIINGRADIGNITGNLIGSLQQSASIVFNSTYTGAVTTDIHGIYYNVSQSVTVANNRIGGIDVENSSTGIVDLFGIRTITNSANTIQITNNKVGSSFSPLSNNAVSNNSNVFGIVAQNGIASVESNDVTNLIMIAGTTSTGQQASVIGLMVINTSSTTGNTIAYNTIHTLTNTHPGNAVHVYGIQYDGTITGVHQIYSNVIHSLVTLSTNSSANLRGINITSGTSAIFNNMIRLGIHPSGSDITQGLTLYGIYDSNTVSTGNAYYYNTVYIGGEAVTGSANTWAFRSDGTTNTRNFRNNIFHNARSNGSGTGRHYAIQVGGMGVNPQGLTSNNNNLRSSGSSGSVLGWYDGLERPDLNTWISATGQDQNSVAVIPTYINPTGDTALVSLKINTTSSSPLESGGIHISTVNVDHEGDIRQGSSGYSGSGTAPDIGADEFSTSGCTLMVMVSGDGGPGSLREVISCAQAGDTIYFHPSLMAQTLVLTSGEIVVSRHLCLEGLGASNLALSGNHTSRIFHVLPGIELHIQSLSMIQGASIAMGGAILVEGSLFLRNVVLAQNHENGMPKAMTLKNTARLEIQANVEIRE